MIVYRLANSVYAKDLTGEGARLHGGRWNHTGIPCIYSSESRSLAVIEFPVHVNVQSILRNLSMVELDIPAEFYEVKIPTLPGDWRASPAPPSTKDFGTAILSAASHPVIKIPSTVIPEEFNYIINPRHPLIQKCKIISVADFSYDVRIKS